MRRHFATITFCAFAAFFSASSVSAAPKEWNLGEVKALQYKLWQKARAAYFITTNTVTDGGLGNTYETLYYLYYFEMGAGQLEIPLEDDASTTGYERSWAVWQRVVLDSRQAQLYMTYSRLNPSAVDAINAAMAVRDELAAYYPVVEVAE